MSDPIVERFMRAVLPWPGEDAPGWVNLHYDFVPQPGKKMLKIVPGWAFKTMDGFQSMVAFGLARHTVYRNFWQCMSLQKDNAGPNKTGKNYRALRKKDNALSVKSLWLDLDLDPADPKKYPDEATAMKAILVFCKKYALPDPSCIVHSGNGLHMYWANVAVMTVDEWRPLAEGFKALLLKEGIKIDPVCTGDVARLMRLPTTFNKKDLADPKPVVLLTKNIIEHDFSTKPFQDLKQYAVIAPPPAPKTQSEHFDAAAFNGAKPSPVFKGIDNNDKLSAGLERLVHPKPVFDQCPMYDEALKTGGNGYNQGLWMLQILGTTFMEGGNDLAHAISKGDARYTPDGTDQMFSRKMADRDSFGLGYPSCATFKGAGSKACEGCPLLAKGKSPLNLRPFVPVTATVTSATPALINGTADDPDVWMPYEEGFEFNENGVVCSVHSHTDKEGNTDTSSIPLFKGSVLSDFWISKGSHHGEVCHFVSSADKGCLVQVDLPVGNIFEQSFKKFLALARVLPNPNALPKTTETFFVSVIEKLRAIAEAQTAVPFGWYTEKGQIRGFAYGGKLFLDDKSERTCAGADPVIMKNYRPQGSLDQWMKAARCVTDRKRPELTVIMLTSFLSPLLQLVGRSTILFSAFSPDSGGGKTSAYKAGLSVWGHPTLTKGTESQTKNNITTQMKTIRNLPFYWDEITDDKYREIVWKVMHEADGGKEKGRNLDGQRTQDAGTWMLAMHYASNQSLLQFLRKHNPTTSASANRVLEWEVKNISGVPGDRPPGWMPDAEATTLMDTTERNYGLMGLKYARFLADNHERITAECIAKINEVEEILQTGNAERYWICGVGLMVQAAKYALELGLDVNPAEIEEFMFKVYRDNYNSREEYSSGGVVDHSEDATTRYLKKREAEERGIWSDHIALGKGRSVARPMNILKGPTQPKNTQGGVEFRFALEQQMLFIAQRDFTAWLESEKLSEPEIRKGLAKVYGDIKVKKIALLRGWKQDAGREYVLHIPVRPGTPLWDYMVSVSTQEERARLATTLPVALDDADAA
jgi:hypothetical protein